MSQNAEAQEPEEKDGDDAAESPSGRTGCLGAIMPVTTPGCASWLVAVFLVTTVVTVWIVFWLDPNNVPWRHAFSWWRIAAIIGLMICIPWIVYKMTSLWLKGVPGAFPELDYAWRAGLHALQANELSITSVPIFMITGSSGEAQEKAIMNASGLRFSIEGVPQGPAPIHWYANSEAIYLFCSDCSWASALASLREEMATEAAASGLAAESPVYMRSMSDLSAYQRTPMPIASEPYSSPARTDVAPTGGTNYGAPAPMGNPGSAGGNYRGTVMLNDAGGSPAAAMPSGSSPAASTTPPGGGLRGTLILNDSGGAPSASAPSTSPASIRGTASLSFTSPSAPAQPVANPPAPTPAASQTWTSGGYSGMMAPEATSRRKPVLLSHQYAAACLQELQYLGQLIRHARQPLCPINGILSLVQFESIHSTAAELEELQKAVRADLETIQYAFQLRAPVSALVVGLEKERGFRELVLRVGKDRAMNQRFGRRFDVHALPTRSELQALTVHVCGVFEDWAYSLFREEHALTRPGNTRLYELLSKVRCEWKMRLSDILSGGFGCEPGKNNEPTSNLFSGCYFAATGETPDRQAFVKGVIDKLNEEQELIEWTTTAQRASQRQNVMANLGMIVTLGLLVCLLVMVFFLG